MQLTMDDRLWQEAVDFVEAHAGADDVALAPTEMREGLERRCWGYDSTFADPPELQWLVFHKGMLNQVDPLFLNLADVAFVPVFANDVFVVWTRHELPELDWSEAGFRAYREIKGTLFEGLLSGDGPADRSIARSRVETVYLGDHTALTTLNSGHKLFVDTRDLSLTPHLLLEGTWERWLTEVLSRLLRPGMTFVDVGANFGYYSVLAASQVGPRGRVFSFEANDAVADLLWRSVNVNGFEDRVTVVPRAVHETSGKISFSRLERLLGASRVADFDAALLEQYHDEAVTVQVDAVSLDDFFADDAIGVDVVKIDAEGSEPAILRGMAGILRSRPAVKVVFEYGPDNIRSAGDDPLELLHELMRSGLRLQRINHDGSIVNVDLADLPHDHHCELLLTKATAL